MSNVVTYKPDKVIFTAFGVAVDELSESNFITVEYDVDQVTKINDLEEGGIYSVRKSKPGVIKISLLPSSRWVTLFANYSKLRTPLAISIEDKNTYDNRFKFFCEKAMILQEPVPSFDSEAQPIEVTFTCINLRSGSAPVNLIPNIEA